MEFMRIDEERVVLVYDTGGHRLGHFLIPLQVDEQTYKKWKRVRKLEHRLGIKGLLLAWATLALGVFIGLWLQSIIATVISFPILFFGSFYLLSRKVDVAKHGIINDLQQQGHINIEYKDLSDVDHLMNEDFRVWESSYLITVPPLFATLPLKVQ